MAWRIAVVVLVFAVGFTARLAYEETVRSAYAQEDLYDCDDFTYQEEAQAVFDENPRDPYGLDEDDPDPDDSIACEALPSRDEGGAAGDQYDDGGEITVGPQGSDNRTPKTGGPKFEVFPLQADGDCPRPLVKRDGACYP